MHPVLSPLSRSPKIPCAGEIQKRELREDKQMKNEEAPV
jgi:hypothetical protein